MDINSPKLSALPRPVERAVIFDDVRFSYDDERDVLRGISAWLDMREYTVVLGENGSGKSTLAKHINALLIPDSGSVHVRGSDTSHERCMLEIRRNCAMVFQNPDNQMVANTVRDDVAFGPENLGLNREAIIERVDQALAEVALEAFAERDPNSLSGGEKQRVAIAGVLALRPELIVFDEPGAMLDPRGRRGIRRVMRELNDAGIGVVHITHFMDEALAADKVIVMKEGKIALSGTPTEVFAYGDDIRSLGLEEPFAMQLAQALQGRGVPVPDTGNMEDIIETLYAGGCVDESAVHSVTAEADCSSDKRFVCGVRERRHGQYEPEHNSFSIFGRNEKNTFGHASENIAALGLKNTAEQGITNAAAHDAKSLVGEIEFRGVTFAADPKAVKLLRRAPETASREHGAILAGIDLRIAAGEFCCIVGHTGSGKSTLVEQIKGLHAPTTGEILIDGEIAGEPRQRNTGLNRCWSFGKSGCRREEKAQRQKTLRAMIGYVSQYPEYQLFAETVFADVTFGPKNFGASEAQREEMYAEAMREVGLDPAELRETSPFELSGGQKRRVAFAGILAMRPKVLIVDEPMAGLDPRGRQEIKEILQRLHSVGTTIVMVSHSMDDVAQLAEHIVVLNHGKVFMEGNRNAVFSRAQELRDIGLGIPKAAACAKKLAARGWEFAPIPYTLDELADAIANQWCGRNSQYGVENIRQDSGVSQMFPASQISSASHPHQEVSSCRFQDELSAGVPADCAVDFSADCSLELSSAIPRSEKRGDYGV